jgi:hypothetical protein
VRTEPHPSHSPCRRALLALAALASGWAASSCAPSGFADEAQIQSVRILASSADKPYAKPGDMVTVQVLAFDGRPVKREPMTLSWLPIVCENPQDDAYYACFAQFAAKMGPRPGGDAGAGGGTGGPLPRPGIDLSPFLPTGPSFAFQMPDDAVTSHPSTPGVKQQYGLAIVFNIACAGHLELVPIDPNNINPQAVPIGCFDADHNQLGAEDWVFGFTRVYAYDSVTNANPVIDYVDVQGQHFTPDPQSPGVLAPPSPGAGAPALVTSRCPSGDNSCPKVTLGPHVPPSSQEVQAQVNGSQKEEIWADYYSTIGSFKSSARLLYDSMTGAVGDTTVTSTQFYSPADPGAGVVWIVVHDNRGGVSWITLPVQVN